MEKWPYKRGGLFWGGGDKLVVFCNLYISETGLIREVLGVALILLEEHYCTWFYFKLKSVLDLKVIARFLHLKLVSVKISSIHIKSEIYVC